MYKRDKKKKGNNFPFILKGKWFSILERAIFFLEEMVYTPLQAEQCKIENRKNNFLQICFAPYQNKTYVEHRCSVINMKRVKLIS